MVELPIDSKSNISTNIFLQQINNLTISNYIHLEYLTMLTLNNNNLSQQQNNIKLQNTQKHIRGIEHTC